MELYLYCSPNSRDILMQKMQREKVTWIVRNHLQDLLDACRTKFKSGRYETEVLVLAAAPGIELRLRDIINEHVQSESDEPEEPESSNESLMVETQRKVIPEIVGGYYKVLLAQESTIVPKGRLGAVSLVQWLDELQLGATAVHIIFPDEDSAKTAINWQPTTTEGGLAVIPPEELGKLAPGGEEEQFESLMPDQQADTLLDNLPAVERPGQPSSVHEKEEEEFDPLVLEKEILASSKLIAKNKEILELKRVINNLHEELRELRQQNCQMAQVIAQLSAQSKENEEADHNTIDVVRKRRRVDDGTSSARKSVPVISVGYSDDLRTRQQSTLSRYRHQMLELERRCVQLEDELSELKYSNIRLP